jgi:hypothetical protein
MGANATTFVPSYTSGEVLTAANLSVTNSGIPVFATTVTRDAAFGGTGEKTLAEGQFAYIEATNTTQYYDGAAWQSVGVAPALVYLGGTTGSASASINVDSVFSATYTNYLVQVSSLTASVEDPWAIRLRASGSTITAANYTQAGTANQSSSDTVFARRATNGTYWFGDIISTVSTNPQQVQFFISNPFAAVSTRGNITSAGGTNADYRNCTLAVNYNATTSADGIALVPYTSGTLTGTIRVYGIVNS